MSRGKTQNYQMEYFNSGSNYDSTIDYRRFVTLDYNLESYVGIVGVGIINGLNVEQVSGTTVQILPGTGIIDGYAVKSPYTYKLRSEMVMGDYEFETLHDLMNASTKTTIVYPNLTDAQMANYVAVVQDYNPSFCSNGCSDMENCPVNAGKPVEIVLNDNSETYILGERLFTTPYPALADYPLYNVVEPKQSDYTTYALYKQALSDYSNHITIINNFEWRDDTANHYDTINFTTSHVYSKSSSKILIARVLTKDGSVSKIDTSMVDSLQNMQASIKKIAKNVIKSHRHGGDKYYDPPKIRLETDIRKCVLKSYNPNTKKSVYNILENQDTGVTLGHQHNYYIDSSGNGFTVEKFGSLDNHWHKISSNVVGSPELTASPTLIEDHTHSLPSQDTVGAWDSSSPFEVYVNNKSFGDQDSNDIEVDTSNKLLTVLSGIGAIYNTYSMVINVNTPEAVGIFSFTKSSYSVLSFMLDAITQFNIEYGNAIVESNDISNHPFLFETSDGSYAGLEDLISQSMTAQANLKVVGDKFMFTPNAARNVPITLTVASSNTVYDVKIEILGNTEVTGILKPENITYVSAEKIQLGELEAARIPFVSHIGRMQEDVLAFKYPLVSSDGIRYNVNPAITSIVDNHYHKLFLNVNQDGITEQTMIGDDPVYYATGKTGTTYLVDHIHGVSNVKVSSQDSAGLTEWLNDLNGTNNNSAAHAHEIIMPIVGNPKMVYSISEDKNGNIFAGTSSGLMVISNVLSDNKSYLFVVNDEKFYVVGDDLWTLLNEVKGMYEQRTGKILLITPEVYASPIARAANVLSGQGDSVYMTGQSQYNTTGLDKIMIKFQEYFEVPNFKYVANRRKGEIKKDEIVIGEKYINLATGEEITKEEADTLEKEEQGSTEIIYVVERNLNDVPVWSSAIRDADSSNENLVVCGCTTFAQANNLSENYYENWASPDIPLSSGSLRKIINDSSNNIWIAASGGLFVSRAYQMGSSMDMINSPSLDPKINDIMENNANEIYIACDDGIYKTIDGGAAWTESFSNGCSQIIKDYITSDMHAVGNDGIIYETEDDGNTWTELGTMISGESSGIFGYNGIYASTNDGLYYYEGSVWEKVFDEPVYSYSLSYDKTKVYLGCYNKIYSTSDFVDFTLVIEMEGNPKPLLYLDNNAYYFNYAYGSKGNSFYFKDLTYNSEASYAMVSFGDWMPYYGIWDNRSKYDIFIDKNLALSTKSGIDRREYLGYSFNVYPEIGRIDFSGTAEATKGIEVNDNNVEVVNVHGFQTGDEILLSGNASSFYTSIEALTYHQIYFGERSDTKIDLPISIDKIPNVDGETKIKINIYESKLSEIGNNSHEEVEDDLSKVSDGKPYRLNNAFLSNLLQLTQAIKAANASAANVNSRMKNFKLYDFDYTWNPLDSNYIGNYVDLYDTDVYNFNIFNNVFFAKGAKQINKVLMGTNIFYGNIIVGTDMGIYWAKVEDGLEGNWFYVEGISASVYDLKIFGNQLFACTADGTYITSDMQTWTLQTDSQIYFPSTRASYRWSGGDTVFIPSEMTTFTNNYFGANVGSITCASNVYGSLIPNRKIEIVSSNVSGVYTINQITASNHMTIYETFLFSNSNANTVTETSTIRMGAWWEYLKGETASMSPNAVLVGGENKISYCANSYGCMWSQSYIPTEIVDFQISDFCSLTNGSILASAQGTNPDSITNYIFESVGSGVSWDLFKKIEEIRGTIEKSSLTSFGHTKITVAYTYPSPNVYMDGNISKRDISIVNSNSEIIYKGRVLWNENRDGKDEIYVYGNELNELPVENSRFIVYPLKINGMTELEDGTIFFSTDEGVYTDNQTAFNVQGITGTIFDVANGGTVTKIDLSGNILNTTSTNGKVSMQISTNDNISAGSLNGWTLYLDSDISYPILTNGNKNSSSEINVVLDEDYSIGFSYYIGKKATLVSPYYSRVYFDNSGTALDQFKGGKLYIASGNNMGDSYGISNSATTYVDIVPPINPNDIKSLVVGQNIKIVDGTGKIDLHVFFDSNVATNQLVGMNITGSSLAFSDNPSTIYSNDWQKITLNQTESSPLDFTDGDYFKAYGLSMSPHPYFNNKETSIEDGHYHEVNVVGQTLSGLIASFSNANVLSSYVDINVSNVSSEFETDLVQRQGDLFYDAKIQFYNENDRRYYRESRVVSHDSSSIRVVVEDPSQWDFTSYQLKQISNGWSWAIDATNYGYTENTNYDDFVSLITNITQEVAPDSTTLKVANSSGMVAGDRIRIIDTSNKSELNVINSVSDLTTILLESRPTNYFYMRDIPYVEVLRNTFTNNHTHQIRNNQLQHINIPEYLAHGYNSSHSHESLPFIKNVSKIITDGSRNVAVGSSENIYICYNSNDNWDLLVNLNDWVSNGISEVTVVGDISFDQNGKFVVGTGNGYVVVEQKKRGIVPLEKPELLIT